AAGRVELAAQLAFGGCELAEEVLVDPAEDVLGPRLLVAEADAGDQVNELPEALGGNATPGVVTGQDVLEAGVGFLDLEHRIVNPLGDVGCLGLGLKLAPAGRLGHPE